uniref:Uncharacterized protein n=1 Tax=Chrysotila carterae TaxID=13221 RepID=A0A7S4EYY2_CHRCT
MCKRTQRFYGLAEVLPYSHSHARTRNGSRIHRGIISQIQLQNITPTPLSPSASASIHTYSQAVKIARVRVSSRMHMVERKHARPHRARHTHAHMRAHYTHAHMMNTQSHTACTRSCTHAN